ncbi:Peptidase aspartic [Ascosphaera apis ARSEF 7405]|uniref:Peptidase aspartic n=1 Tax=Ascosphaera apis ARSEF 7405 TaxID=392613 RepID=A0A167XSI2_9EURO|nr:Peptidase aspartic [Ascosphaera apis ARSEF 7405]
MSDLYTEGPHDDNNHTGLVLNSQSIDSLLQSQPTPHASFNIPHDDDSQTVPLPESQSMDSIEPHMVKDESVEFPGVSGDQTTLMTEGQFSNVDSSITTRSVQNSSFRNVMAFNCTHIPGSGPSIHVEGIVTLTPSDVYRAVTLVDCGAESNMINERFVRANNLPVHLFAAPQQYCGFTGGEVIESNHFCLFKLTLGRHSEIMKAVVIPSTHMWDIILADEWLRTHNPIIDFRRRALYFTAENCAENNCVSIPTAVPEWVPTPGESQSSRVVTCLLNTPFNLPLRLKPGDGHQEIARANEAHPPSPTIPDNVDHTFAIPEYILEAFNVRARNPGAQTQILCRFCSKPASRASAHTFLNNVREFWTCTNPDCFASTRVDGKVFPLAFMDACGNLLGNPRCVCKDISRLQLGTQHFQEGPNQYRRLYFVCRRGGCSFYKRLTDEVGREVWFPETQIKTAIENLEPNTQSGAIPLAGDPFHVLNHPLPTKCKKCGYKADDRSAVCLQKRHRQIHGDVDSWNEWYCHNDYCIYHGNAAISSS